MAKVKSKWVCQNCGYESAGYLGKCPECSSWGCFIEEVMSERPGNIFPQGIVNECTPSPINDIQIGKEIRVSTGISEFDRILGGGLVQGSIILIAGDPGIGKSTILLQTSGGLANSGKKVLYVSAEESAGQLKLRADRLGVSNDSLYIYPQTNLECIKSQIGELKPDMVVIDSIQAIYSQTVQSSAGSVSQIRECCNILMQIAKTKNISVLVIGHVTKDGNIAGPKVLEHMVDTVISFEGDKYKSYRMLRSMKNRFGNTSEVGIFEMSAEGLKEVINPNQLFLNERSQENIPGTAIIVTNEGSRPLLVEIQALVGATPYPSPRRVANGVDFSRLLQILAVLEKRVGLNLSKQDVYVNVMGGIEVNEPSADLGIALAIATCARDVVVDSQTAIIGEIGLSGEIHPVSNLERMLNEASMSGFKKAIIPYANKNVTNSKIRTVPVKRLIDAISACITQGTNLK